MKMNKPDKEYIAKVEKMTKNSPIIKDCIFAFLIGGGICTVGEFIFSLLLNATNSEKTSRTIVSVIFIVITAIFTGIGIYDKFAKVAGAGLSVPISGFANSVCAPAIEYSIEGHVLGTAEKMFSIAGAVIVYGCSLASLYGAIYYFFIKGAI